MFICTSHVQYLFLHKPTWGAADATPLTPFALLPRTTHRRYNGWMAYMKGVTPEDAQNALGRIKERRLLLLLLLLLLLFTCIC